MLSPWTQILPGRWTFWADRWDGKPLGPIQLLSCRLSQGLSSFGSAEVVVSATESPIEHDDLLRLWSWRLWVAYEGQTLFCGLPSVLRDEAKAAIALGFTEIHGYLTKRAFDLVDGKRYDQIEQTQIARDIADPVTEMGVRIVTEAGSGFPRDRSYRYLEGPYRANLLINLSNVIGGPEFRMEYGQPPDAVLRIAYPRVGNGDSGLGLSVPGNAIGPGLTWDSENLRTRTYSVGDVPEGEPEDTPKPVVVVDGHLLGISDPLMPRLDGVDDWPSVILISTLIERANTNARIYARPTLQVSGNTVENDPPLNSYGLGDDVTVRFATPFESEGLQVTGRLMAREIDCATGRVGWTVTLTVPSTRARMPISTQVTELRNLQTSAWRQRLAPHS